MSKTPTRRELLRQAAMASGAVALMGVDPAGVLAGQAEPTLGALFICVALASLLQPGARDFLAEFE